MTVRTLSIEVSAGRVTMKGLVVLLLVSLCCLSGTLAKKGFGPGEQEWGYVEVRPKAFMFWWLYLTTANVSSFYDKPLVIWLQGGPGGSSTSFGNFEELGPLDTDLKARNYTWVKDYNVLFIDNPVGTGFSYVDDPNAYATTNAQIAKDLVTCMKGFFKQLPAFQDVATYITTESYGGKMGAEFALVWFKEQKAGSIKSNLKGVALGDAWVSPIDSVLTWAPFLLATGMVDTAGYKEIDKYAQMTLDAIKAGNWATATDLWGFTEGVIMKETDNIDFYNILTKVPARGLLSRSMEKFPFKPSAADQSSAKVDGGASYAGAFPILEDLMNGPVRKALGLSTYHSVQSGVVFDELRTDFMKPVINIVEQLLNETDMKVVVLTGHMDLIVDTPGTLLWVEQMKWKNAKDWLAAKRRTVVSDRIIEGYVKSYGKLAMYWMNRAGHMVPKDNPAGMAKLLEDLTAK